MAADTGPLRVEDVEHVKANLRPADRLEIELFTGREPAAVVDETVHLSVVSGAGLWLGETCCIYGVAPRAPGSPVGVPWLLSTPSVERHAPALLRGSAAAVREMRKMFPWMENVVHAENRHALGWLKWLGFAMDEARPMGVSGAPFIRFHMGR